MKSDGVLWVCRGRGVAEDESGEGAGDEGERNHDHLEVDDASGAGAW